MIAIVDYKLNNLRSVEKALSAVGAACVVSDDEATLRRADRLLLPGVGAFGEAMRRLRETGFDRVIADHVAAGKPLLGICLGMQLLFDESEERGQAAGLGLLPGRVAAFRATDGLKVPHMGWNEVTIRQPDPLVTGVDDSGAYAYFVHSYRVVPADSGLTLATSDYGGDFPAVVGRGHVYGIQFHPEKSGAFGFALLRNFAQTQVP